MKMLIVVLYVGGEPGPAVAEAVAGHGGAGLLQEGAHRAHLHGLQELR